MEKKKEIEVIASAIVCGGGCNDPQTAFDLASDLSDFLDDCRQGRRIDGKARELNKRLEAIVNG